MLRCKQQAPGGDYGIVEPQTVRKYPRLEYTFPISFALGPTTQRVRATTLGGGGLFITVNERVPTGTQLSLQFRLAKYLPLIKAKARVCYWIPDRGIGVEFMEIAEEARQNILRWIHSHEAEQRRHPRVPLVAQVESPELTTLAYARDISAGGMFIACKQMLPPRTPVNLRFYLENNDEDLITAWGEIAYGVEKVGMGVRFTSISSEGAARIHAYVCSRLEAGVAS